MVALIDEPRAVGQVFNIGNGAEISIAELAERIKSLTGSALARSCRIPYDEAYEAGFEDMPRRVPDISQDQARWSATSPTVELDEILDARHRALPSAVDLMPEPLKIKARARGAGRAAAAPATPSRCAACCSRPDGTGRRRAGDRADREHEHLQRQVRVLPARRHAPQAGRHVVRAVPQDRRRVRRARHHPRPHAQLRRAFMDRQLVEKVRYAKTARHPGSRDDQQRLADHRDRSRAA